MLDRLTVSDFVEHLNANFPVDPGSAEGIELELIEAQTIGEGRRSDSPGTRQQPFSLIFRGPRPVAPPGYASGRTPHSGYADHFSRAHHA